MHTPHTHKHTQTYMQEGHILIHLYVCIRYNTKGSIDGKRKVATKRNEMGAFNEDYYFSTLNI